MKNTAEGLESFAVFFYLLSDAFCFITFKRCRTVIVFITGRRQRTRNDVNVIVIGNFTVCVDSKSLLEDHRILIRRIFISPKTEVSQTVGNIFSIILFNAFQYMWMMTNDKVGSFIDGQMCKFFLGSIWCVFFFNSPVEINDNNLCPCIF